MCYQSIIKPVPIEAQKMWEVGCVLMARGVSGARGYCSLPIMDSGGITSETVSENTRATACNLRVKYAKCTPWCLIFSEINLLTSGHQKWHRI